MELEVLESTAGDIAVARWVLRREADALGALADMLDDRFVQALDLMAAAPGRIIATGMGKSGHVARKVAATFASTGTPALFLHPAEASHGDLGMVAPGDVVLALSNSGETAELENVVAYAARNAIPLIAITGRAGSTLADAATVALVLPTVEEACPLGLAPTTSTTMALALGDALAVALLQRKEFSTDDFQALHPGGALGRKLLRVRTIMHSGDGVPLVRPESPMAEALVVMTAKSLGCVGVRDARGILVGVITDGDLRRHMDHDLITLPAEAVMTRAPQTIRPQALAVEALGVMNARSITSLFVVEDRRPIGVVHIHDCLRAGIG